MAGNKWNMQTVHACSCTYFIRGKVNTKVNIYEICLKSQQSTYLETWKITFKTVKLTVFSVLDTCLYLNSGFKLPPDSWTEQNKWVKNTTIYTEDTTF